MTLKQAQLLRGLSLGARKLTSSSLSKGGIGIPISWRRIEGRQLRAWFSSYPPHQVVGLPTLSPTMDTGSIAAWNLGEGDGFAPGDIFCSVETDKATVDFEAQEDGFIAKILVAAGSTELKVGDPIMVTVEDAGDVAAFADYKLDASAAAAAAPPPPAEAPAAPAPTSPAAPRPAAPAAPAAESGKRVFASPLARKLAKEMGFAINSIVGTGPGGRIIAADVKEYTPAMEEPAVAATAGTPAPAQAALSAAPLAAPVPGAGYTDYPLSEQAKEMAMRLTQAKRNVPHYYLTVDVCVDELLKVRAKLNEGLGEDSSLGVFEFLIKAAAASMKTVPSANASWMDSVVRVYESVDINVVVGSGDTLYAPVIQDCGGKGLKAISKELNEAVAVLNDSEEQSTAVGGLGTLTIVNLGMYGVKSCAPIIREPQACALAIGALENRIVPNDDDSSDEIYKESIIFTATLSCDHRVVDGAVGAQWLASFKALVENPSTLLL